MYLYFFLFCRRIIIVTKNVAISAITIEYQIPLTLKNIGKINTQPISKINVWTKEIIAETKPLFKAVKKWWTKTVKS